jgi:hypothetical protein
VYAVANLDGADRLDRIGAALRGEIAFEQTEVALSGSWRREEPLRLGGDVSTGLGPFELRVEAALLYDVGAPFFRGELSVEKLLERAQRLDLLGFQREADRLEVDARAGELIPQIVVGTDLTLDYGDSDQAILGLEYFFNDAGYDSADLYPFLLLVPGLARSDQPVMLPDMEATTAGELTQRAFGLQEAPPGLFQPLYLGRHYLSAFALFPAPFDLQDHTFTLTGIANLSDRSAVARIDHSVRLFRFLSLRSYLNVHFGDRGEFRFGLDLDPVPGSGFLDDGLSQPPPLFELGVALNATL